jgi:Flp pilus assembly protein TadB
MAEIAALDNRVTRLENQISDGFERIENLLRQEISDLKKEQIDDLKKANERLADDQRRMWDRLVDMERRENRRAGDHSGSHRVIGAIWAFLCAAAGGAIAWLAGWLTSGSPPPHH